MLLSLGRQTLVSMFRSESLTKEFGLQVTTGGGGNQNLPCEDSKAVDMKMLLAEAPSDCLRGAVLQ